MEKIITDEERIDSLLSRGVEDIIVKEDLKKELMSGRQLRIKFGIDPTGPKIHLGRAVPLRKLREFQNLGHQIVLIIGNFTAQIGDASDKTEKRPIRTRAEIDENIKDYKNQIGKIIDVSKTEFVYNDDWLSKLTFADVVKMSDCFSVQQMLARRNFKDRYEAGTEISLREFLYPMMQGYDSVQVKADVEIGGFDQLFNVKAGRTMQEFFGQSKQNIITFAMLEGTDGRKMSTSWGNIITIVDEPYDMFGKIMSIRDDLIIKYMNLCTDASQEEINDTEKQMKEGVNPMEFKMKLGSELVRIYHGEQNATFAKNEWIKTFQQGGVPEEVKEIIVKEGEILGEVLVANEIVSSKTDWRRLVEAGSISDKDDKKITDPKQLVYENVFKVGKKRFVKIVVR